MKKDEGNKIEWSCEDGIWVGRSPKRPVSVGAHLYALYAASFPYDFIPAGQYGLPKPPAEVIADLEELETAARKMAAIRAGAARGRREGHETRRADADQGALLADVKDYRRKHPSHGLPRIAEALVDKHGRIRDHADPRSREKAIEALRKRIARLEKSLDT